MDKLNVAGLITPLVSITAVCFALTPLPTPAAPVQSAQSTPITTYINPLNVSIADPFVLHDGDTYYMYGTTDYGGAGFQVFTSSDLVRWNRAGVCYRPDKDSWGTQQFWAPEVVKKDNAYYLHYTAMSRPENRRNILVAKSDSPLGPFKDYAGPLFPDQSVIDSHIYHDDETGEYFVYASPENDPPSRIIGAKLALDFKSLLTLPTICLTSEYGWEDLWIEAPVIHRHKDTLYMIYSGSAFWEAEYALGYATAKSPLGPWKKSDTNPILSRTPEVEGPGHNGLAWSPDKTELFVMYHRHTGPWTIKRMAALDRLVFEPAGDGPDILRLAAGPTTTPQPLPSGAKPLHSAASDDFSSDTLDMARWEIFNNHPEAWTIKDGQLVIKAGTADLWRHQLEGRNVFLQRLPEGAGDFALETSVTMNTTRIHEQAFLTLWRDDDNYVLLATAMLMGSDLQFITTFERFGKANAGLFPNTIGRSVCLRLEKRGTMLKVFASTDGENWKPVGRDVNIDGMDFTHIGLGAWSPGVGNQTPAHFDWFRIHWL